MADLFCTIDYESPFRRICVITLTALIAAAFSNMSVAVVNYFVDDLTWGEVSETIVEEIPIVLEDFLLKNFNI